LRTGNCVSRPANAISREFLTSLLQLLSYFVLNGETAYSKCDYVALAEDQHTIQGLIKRPGERWRFVEWHSWAKLHSEVPSVLWHCWLCIRKSIQPVKNWVMRCWYGHLSGARCRLFAYGPADATASQNPCHLLPHWNPDRFYLSGTGLPRLSWKRGHCDS